MSQPVAVYVLVLVGAYLIGSVPVAWLLGRWNHGVDLRAVGSGNPGTSNLFRNVGLSRAAVSGPVQFAQGLAPVLIARAVGGDQIFIEVAAVVAVLGNGWPVWFGFRGQRCIAVATGAVAALHPLLLAVLLVCFGAGALTHAIALGVLVGFSALPIVAAWLWGPGLAVTCGVVLLVILLRRLDGLLADLHGPSSRQELTMVLRRVFLDERPGQVLVGPRDGTGPVERHPG